MLLGVYTRSIPAMQHIEAWRRYPERLERVDTVMKDKRQSLSVYPGFV